ncbi:putative monovalent cation/H+ antiporter subunit F [Oxobacter pfennigii]|uniref:Putative monovalent cation/H+ antiporter subunit F n=1 Tax=Oxobacter pfennigii TaxID=36849 RepID=A0A0P8W1K7_9CLOT|nr:monovalent cation/H+ antiporter complex subunit F [Oxobacter pfennigii]KPU42306.1 putative monovalent cation/H+ antiporter subunit F [Oxobacter pfennigii]
MIMLYVSIFLLSFTIVLLIIRAITGPKIGDRLIAINAISTKIIMLLLIISFLFNETYFVDVAFIYSSIGFLASIVISKYNEFLSRRAI